MGNQVSRFANLGHARGETFESVVMSNHALRADPFTGTPYKRRVQRQHKRARKAEKAARRVQWRKVLKTAKERGVEIPTPAAVLRGKRHG